MPGAWYAKPWGTKHTRMVTGDHFVVGPRPAIPHWLGHISSAHCRVTATKTGFKTPPSWSIFISRCRDVVLSTIELYGWHLFTVQITKYNNSRNYQNTIQVNGDITAQNSFVSLTRPFGAFRRKKALHDSHEMASKLKPIARSPQTPQILSRAINESVDFVLIAGDGSRVCVGTPTGDCRYSWPSAAIALESRLFSIFVSIRVRRFLGRRPPWSDCALHQSWALRCCGDCWFSSELLWLYTFISYLK